MKTFFHFLLVAFINLSVFLSFTSANNKKGVFVCPSTNITLTTQADVDNFTTNFPACTDILASLIIGPSTDITNLNGLSGITSIGNSLEVKSNNLLTDASGLNDITSIGDALTFNGNTELTSLPTFSNLNSVRVGINISNHPKLTQINLSAIPITNLTASINIVGNDVITDVCLPTTLVTIGVDLAISANPLLSNLCELGNLETIGNVLQISNTIDSDLPDFPSLTLIGRGLTIQSNQEITELPAFTNLTTINGNRHIDIDSNPKLTKIDLSSVSVLNAIDINIRGNAVLTNVCLPNNMSTVGAFTIHTNPMLIDICEMDKLTTIQRGITINNTIEPELPDFPNLETIGNGISILGNLNITELPAFSNLATINTTTIGSFMIANNPELKEINLPNVSAPVFFNVQVESNSELTNICLPSDITTVSNQFRILINPKVLNICANDNLTTIGSNFILNNTLDSEFPNYPNLTTISGELQIESNSELLELPSFDKLTSIGSNLNINTNLKLCFCSIPPICTYLSGGGSRTISNNKGYCLNETNVQQFCTNGKPTTNATTDKSICNTATVPLIPFTSSQSGMTFSWINDNTNIGLAASGNGDLPSFTATNSGTAPIEAEIIARGFFNDCLNIPDTFKIKINPTPAISASSNSPVCAGATLQLDETGNAATMWSWSGQGGFTNTAKNPTISNLTTANAGNYTVTITDANSCTNTQTISVAVNAAPDFTLQSTSQNACAGSPFDLNSIGVDGTSTLVTKTWHTGSPATTANQLNNLEVSPASTTQYFALLTDNNGCSKELAFSLSINATCSITIADPCSCTDQMNVKNGVGTITHFHDVLAINTGIANQTITLTDNPTNTFLNNSRSPVANNTSLGMTDASGVLNVDFFKIAGASGSITVNNGVSNLSFNLPSCNATICKSDPIPTMSQWGLLIFGLLVLNLGIFFVYQAKEI